MATTKQIIQIKGLRSIKLKFQQLIPKYEKAVTAAVNITCIDVHRDAINNIEGYGTRDVNGQARQWLVDTGRMRNSISITFEDGRDLLDESASPSSHDGVQSSMSARAAGGTARATGVATLVNYASNHELGRGVPKRPFLGPAADANRRKLPERVKDEIKKANRSIV